MDYNGLWKKSTTERCNLVNYTPPHHANAEGSLQGIPQIENYTGYCMKVPIGLVPGCVINGKQRIVTMATEEASVVAANCKANKIIRQHSVGFVASTGCTKNIAEGQIFIQRSNSTCQSNNKEFVEDIQSNDHKKRELPQHQKDLIAPTRNNSTISCDDDWLTQCIQQLSENKNLLIQKSNAFCQSMVQRGGGVLDLKFRKLHLANGFDALAVHLIIDVCDSMGANCVNTVAEGITSEIDAILNPNVRVLYRIVTNYTSHRIVTASFRISMASWGNENLTLAKHVVNLAEWAKSDPLRAVTHNKGIFNGIDSVALACGQDTRAIEAGGHYYASCCDGNDDQQSCGYRPLTEYWMEGDEFLNGKIVIPISAGSKGGSLLSNTMAEYNLKFMGIEDTQDLMNTIASVGLAQNFAALMAIGGDGIQKGHMNLHLNNKRLDGNSAA